MPRPASHPAWAGRRARRPVRRGRRRPRGRARRRLRGRPNGRGSVVGASPPVGRQRLQRVQVGQARLGALRRDRAAPDVSLDDDDRVPPLSPSCRSRESSSYGSRPSRPKFMRNRRGSTVHDAELARDRLERGRETRNVAAPLRPRSAPRACGATSRTGSLATSDSASLHGPFDASCGHRGQAVPEVVADLRPPKLRLGPRQRSRRASRVSGLVLFVVVRRVRVGAGRGPTCC